MKEQKIQLIQLEKLEPPQWEIRTEEDEEELEELAKSIKEHGLLEPIIVKPKGDAFEVVAGARRVRAAIKAKIMELPAIVVHPKDEVEGELIKLHENIHRRNLSPIEEGEVFKTLRERYEWSVDTIAKYIGRSRDYIISRLQVLEAGEKLVEKVRRGEMSFAVAREIARTDDPALRQQMIDYADRWGLTLQQARRWRQEHEQTRVQAALRKEEYEPEPADTPPPVHTEIPTVLFRCFACEEEYKAEDMVVVRMCTDCYKKLSS